MLVCGGGVASILGKFLLLVQKLGEHQLEVNIPHFATYVTYIHALPPTSHIALPHRLIDLFIIASFGG